MRDITHCPNCQTQFFVSEDQLRQHGGLVRCGQCLHVFNAKEQFVPTSTPSPDNTTPDSVNPVEPSPAPAAVTTTADNATPSGWPKIDLDLEEAMPTSHSLEANPAPQATTQPSFPPTPSTAANATPVSEPHSPATHTGALAELPHDTSSIAEHPPHDTGKLHISHHQANDFNELAKHAKRDGKKSSNRRWPWVLGTLLLVLAAVGQSTYFLRNSIAIYYPKLKPQLVQACEHLKCSIELPKQIEWIVIDDSDMQEDLAHSGVMHLSSSLFNKAGFVQAYPNLELTLTNTDDSPVLRRVFKPAEYLAPNTDIAAGFSAGNEIKVKLAITTQDVSVAGYRLYVTY